MILNQNIVAYKANSQENNIENVVHVGLVTNGIFICLVMLW